VTFQISAKHTSCVSAALALAASFLAHPISAQQNTANLELPDAPTPHLAASFSTSETQQQTATPPAAPPLQEETPEQRKARAAAELKAEESQRMLGILPAFNSVIGGKALPLTSGEKFNLFFKSITDPYQFAIVAVDTGIQEAEDSYPDYHHGIPGLLRNYGAAYADDFDGNLFGNAILPSLLHQDPRYYRLGHGSIKSRFWYSITTTVRCKGDNGKWEPNYSNVFGNLIGGAISNVYYPAANRGLGLTINHGVTVTAEGAFGALLLEFYPDFAERHKHKKEQQAAKKAAEAAAATSTQP
jgi:hypothetical protein